MSPRKRFLRLILCFCLYSCAFESSLASRPLQQPAQKQDAEPAPPSDDQLKKENKDLKEKIEQYKKLEEDLVAQRIADKAQSQMMWWLKLGGLATLILGIVGYKVLYDYGKKLVNQRVVELSKSKMESFLREEGQRQVTAIVERQKDQLLQIARQQITHIITSTQPLATKELAGEPAEATLSAPRELKRLDYAPQMQPVRDAGPEGSTVGFALAAALEFQIEKELHQRVTISPRFIYYAAQERDGTSGMDSGAKISTAISVLKTVGAIPEEAWPYKPGGVTEKPPETVKQARHYKIKRSYRLNTVDEIKAGLHTYGPVVTGVTVYASVMSDEVRKTGRFPLPAPSESVLGGHALCIVGYDDQSQLFKARNSWGPQWGDRGYAYIPYAYAERFLSDTYAITLWLTKSDLEEKDSS